MSNATQELNSVAELASPYQLKAIAKLNDGYFGGVYFGLEVLIILFLCYSVILITHWLFEANLNGSSCVKCELGPN